eukprot:scaffold24531_cov122-Cylindrotheca_fusiformis.AAC.3
MKKWKMTNTTSQTDQTTLYYDTPVQRKETTVCAIVSTQARKTTPTVTIEAISPTELGTINSQGVLLAKQQPFNMSDEEQVHPAERKQMQQQMLSNQVKERRNIRLSQDDSYDA